MINYNFTFFIFVTLFFFLKNPYSQNNRPSINFGLKDVISKSKFPEEEITLMVTGDLDKIRSNIKKYNGNYFYSFKNYAKISIPIQEVNEFARNHYVNNLVYQINSSSLLNDTMLIHNRADSVHLGIDPLSESLTGKNVIVGIIDVGIEFNHPDLQDSLGNSRVLYYWNQNGNGNPPTLHNYGTEWNNEDINAGLVTGNLTDDHGTHVTGIAAGNGNAIGKFKGMAPDANIIYVDYYRGFSKDWTVCVAEGVEYIFKKADELNMPAVVNISLGTYVGSHDGTDVASQMIDALIMEKKGRAVVCAAGNSGNADPFHLSYEVSSDTNFTWFAYNPQTGYGFDGLFWELWADVDDFQNVKFSIGADKIDPIVSFRGETDFKSVELGNHEDSLFSLDGNLLAIVTTWTEIIENKYFMQVALVSPDSSDYLYRFSTTGNGKFDIWSSAAYTLSSNIISDSNFVFPISEEFPDILHYKYPDQKSSIVSNWACAQNTITVGNYMNRHHYLDVDSNMQYFTNKQPGDLVNNSSIGPTRDLRMKPEITAPGGIVLSAVRLSTLQNNAITAPEYIAYGGFHKRNSGTSMASPSVAGAVALYFDRCPNATYIDVRNALFNNARTDDFTGITPNDDWGHGKLDIFNALINSLPFPVLSSGDTSVCTNINLFTTSEFDQYNWSNGSIGSSINISEEGNYSVEVELNGCWTNSDSIDITIDPSLADYPDLLYDGDTIFCDSDSLTISIAGNYQNYLWSNNSQTPQITVNNTGYYWVRVLDNNDCSISSDTILVVSNITPPKPLITWGSENELESSPANNYQWYKNGMELIDSTSQTLHIDILEEAVYQVEIFHTNGCSSISDTLNIKPSVGINKLSTSNAINVFPNPTHNTLYINSSLTEIEYVKLFDSTGNLVFSDAPKANTIQVNMEKWSVGLYYLEISGTEHIYFHKVIKK